MSTVYSWSQLRRGEFASRGNLRFARKKAIEVLKKMHGAGWIESGQLIGSVARRDYSTGSDLDMWVVSRPGKEKVVKRFLARACKNLTASHHVKANVAHLSFEDASTGNHRVNSGFIMHASSAVPSECKVGTPIEKVLAPPRVSLDDELTARIANYKKEVMTHKKQLQRWLPNSEKRLNALSAAIDHPLYIMRKILGARNQLPKKGQLIDDSEKTVVRVFFKLCTDKPELYKAATAAINARRRYKKALEQAAKTKGVNDLQAKERYGRELRDIEAVFPQLVKFYSEADEL